MEHMSKAGTWKHVNFAEYAEHSLTADDVPPNPAPALTGGVEMCEFCGRAGPPGGVRLLTRAADCALVCRRRAACYLAAFRAVFRRRTAP